MVTAPARREVVRERALQGLSERRALTVVRMSASSLRYVPRTDPDPGLRDHLCRDAEVTRRASTWRYQPSSWFPLAKMWLTSHPQPHLTTGERLTSARFSAEGCAYNAAVSPSCWTLAGRWVPQIGAVLFLLCIAAPASAQHPVKLNPAQQTEATELERLVEAVADGQLPGGGAWLSWDNHFLRGPDGKTYVPFTLTIDEAPGHFDRVAIYVRVMPHAASSRRETLRAGNPGGLATGQMPVSVPERQFARGQATAGEASAMLAMIEQALKADAPRFPFEDLHFTSTHAVGDGTSRQVRRALAVSPGEYDVYVSVRERPARGQAPKSAVLKRTLEVPDYSANQLLMSSVILTDRIDPLKRALGVEQQLEHPYALGSVELLPASDSAFATDEALSLAFLVYNPALDDTQSPHVTVEYRFFQSLESTQPFRQTGSQVFDRASGDRLDPRNRQFPVSATIPLTTFSPGAYRLEITVRDHLAATSVASNVTFTVE